MVWAIDNGYTEKNTIDRKKHDLGYNPENCRFVDYCVQSANRRITDKNKSGFIGVSFDGNRWAANIQLQGKQNRLGRFKNKVDAAIARDRFVVENSLPHTMNFTIDELNSFL